MEKWQVVHSDGECTYSDETSSIASDWSVLTAEEVEPEDLLSKETEAEPNSNLIQPPNVARLPGRRHPQYRRHGRRGQVTRRLSEVTSSATPVPTAVASVLANALHSTTIATVAASSTAANRSAGWAVCPAFGAARQRRDRAHHLNSRSRHFSASLHTDKKHAKCLFGGALISGGYQRQQVFRVSGGIPAASCGSRSILRVKS